MITRRRLLLSAAAAPLALAGCNVRTINYFPPHPAKVRLVNLLNSLVGMDGLRSGALVWSDIAFQTSTDYVEFENTQTTFSVRAHGTETDLGAATLSLTGNQPYTLIPFGALDAPGLLMLPDAVNAGSGNMQIRLINVGLGTGPTDVYVTAPDANLDETNPNFVGMSSGSSTVGLRLAPGTYRIRATFNGTKAVIYDHPATEFPEGLSTNLILYTLDSASLLQAMLLPVAGTGTSGVIDSTVSAVKVVHAAINAGTIDGFYDGTLFVNDVPYGAFTAYSFQAAGSHAISFEATSTPGAAIATLTRSLDPVSDVSVLVVGFPGAVQAIAFPDNNRAPIAGRTRVRFVNGSSDDAAYDVYAGDTKLVGALAARTASVYFPLAAGTYTITFRDPASGETKLTIADQALAEGRVLTCYAAGATGQLSSIVSTDR